MAIFAMGALATQAHQLEEKLHQMLTGVLIMAEQQQVITLLLEILLLLHVALALINQFQVSIHAFSAHLDFTVLHPVLYITHLINAMEDIYVLVEA